MTVQNLAKQELKKMNESYYGSEMQIKNEIAIMKSSKIEMLYNETIEEWLYKVSTSVNG
jgi:hypothetical protein